MTRMHFQRLTSKQGWCWLGGTLLIVTASLLWSIATGPVDVWGALFVPVMVAALVFVGVRQRQWVEQDESGPVLVERRTFGTRRVPLRTAKSVDIGSNGGGTLQISAADAKTSVRAPVLALTPYVQRSQRPELLSALVDALDGVRAKGAAGIREQLVAQLAHVRRGGDAKSSPLAASATDRTGAVGAAGAAGGISSQL